MAFDFGAEGNMKHYNQVSLDMDLDPDLDLDWSLKHSDVTVHMCLLRPAPLSTTSRT